MRPDKGIKICISPTNAIADSGSSSFSSSRSILSNLARVKMINLFFSMKFLSWELKFLIKHCKGFPGEIFISPLIFRMPNMNFLSHSISDSASILKRPSSGSGKALEISFSLELL